MIKIVIVIGKNKTIDSINEEINDERYKIISENEGNGLKNITNNLYASKNIVTDLNNLYSLNAKNYHNVYLLNFDKIEITKKISKKIKLIEDPMEIVDKYQHSKNELVVIGGKKIIDYFIPYSTAVQVIQTKYDLPGESTFDISDSNKYLLLKKQKIGDISIEMFKYFKG
ncbi:MAG: hypothetical protein GQ557_02695 [Mycoplasmataceae bacterium]|nr:hypothetical protein [Mycoplasmataceae bacterium]